MRVGMITYGLDRPLSGVTRYSCDLVRALHGLAAGPALVLLAAGANEPLLPLNLPSIALPGSQRLPGLLTLGQLALARQARQLQLDLLHDPNGFAPFLFGAGATRTIVTLHDTLPWSLPGYSSRLDNLIHRHWLPFILPRVDLVITDSVHSKNEISKHLRIAAEKIAVVPLAVDERYHPAAPALQAAVRTRYQLPERYLLFVGALQARKNIERLLRACALLWANRQAPPLVIAGKQAWQYEGIYRTVRELGCGEWVHFTDYIPEADLPPLYSAAELFVFPSLYEGFGLPPLEAMACGTPVVCANSSSLPEVVGEAALCVDPYDIGGLARAIGRVCAEPELAASLRERGRQRARLFSWQRTAEATHACYKQVLAKPFLSQQRSIAR
jgi:glycosyltransferase involved in cell wall biosynthesis